MPLRPGEIYWAWYGEGGRRPIVVVSRAELNRGDYVVAVPVTSAKLEVRRRLQNCVPLAAGRFGLDKTCVAQGEHISYVEKTRIDLESGAIGVLDEDTMRDLIRAIGYVISAECEPV